MSGQPRKAGPPGIGSQCAHEFANVLIWINISVAAAQVALTVGRYFFENWMFTR